MENTLNQEVIIGWYNWNEAGQTRNMQKDIVELMLSKMFAFKLMFSMQIETPYSKAHGRVFMLQKET
ncbi:MAG: hypothetical protein ACJARZ_001668 [Dokdonia sp.]|jgi:hypothetical protein